MLGAFEDAVALDAGLPEPVLARAALAVEGLPHRESLRALACAVDVTALFVGRLRWSPRPGIHLLAVGGGPALPDAWAGRAASGWNRLQALHLGAAGRPVLALEAPETTADPFEPLRACGWSGWCSAGAAF